MAATSLHFSFVPDDRSLAFEPAGFSRVTNLLHLLLDMLIRVLCVLPFLILNLCSRTPLSQWSSNCNLGSAMPWSSLFLAFLMLLSTQMATPHASIPKIADEGWRRSGIEVSALQFGYDGQPPLFVRFNLRIAPGSRCLLVGANGSDQKVRQNIKLEFPLSLKFVCFQGCKQLSQGDVPLQGDFSAEHMIFGVDGVDPVRREKLVDLLDIDLQWRMHKVSDGQRRRVQICMGLLHPYKFGESCPHGYLWVTIYHNTKFVMASRLLKPSQVLLLDEITVDLDVVTRMDLLDFFKEECEQREATIVYATHIFDGLETWATDIAYIQEGELRKSAKYSDVEELKSAKNLLSVVESWLRSETKLPKKDPPCSETQPRRSSPFDNSPFRSSRHMAYYR
nr:unnamed protein product [Digitaria exilis]